MTGKKNYYILISSNSLNNILIYHDNFNSLLDNRFNNIFSKLFFIWASTTKVNDIFNIYKIGSILRDFIEN